MRIVVARRRRVSRRHETVDDRLVRFAPRILQRPPVLLPLRQSARPADHAGDDAIGQHPGEGELPGREAALLRVRLQRLGDHERLLPELRLHHPLVLAPGAGVGRRLHAGQVLARQHAPGDGAVGHDADPVVGAGREDLDLGHAVERVVVGLADDGPGHAQLIAEPDHLGNPPAAEVGEPEMADVASPLQITHRAHRLLERLLGHVLVQVVHVDIVGAQAFQAAPHRAQDPAPTDAGIVGAGSEPVADLGGDDPAVPLARHQPTQHPLRLPLRVHVRRIEEVHAGIPGRGQDAAGLRLVGAIGEHHRAQAQGRDLQGRAAERAVLHGVSSKRPRAAPLVKGAARRWMSGAAGRAADLAGV